MSLKYKTVLITGGTRGIGRAIANRFVEEGANVIVTGTGSKCVEHLRDRDHLCVDFKSTKSTALFLEHVRGMPIDICVNNAGINIIKPLEDTGYSDFDAVMKVNLYAPFRVSQVVSEGMVDQKWGRIVNIASIWSVVTKSGRVSYTSSKAGLAGMTRTMAVELAKDNVIVNSVSPGFTMTDLTRSSLSKDEMDAIVAGIPIGRFADPEEIAKLVLFMCSEDNTYVVGQNIVADGGFTNV